MVILNKVEFKKFFDEGYQDLSFTANDHETFIRIKSTYSVPSSTVSSTITNISGKRFKENRWGFFFTEIEEIESNVQADVTITLDKFQIDPEDFAEKDFDDEDFLQHLIEESTEKIEETTHRTILNEMEVL